MNYYWRVERDQKDIIGDLKLHIVDSNRFSVRSSLRKLKPKGEGPEIILFPMIHVAEEEFYEEVSKRVTECDIILYEGVSSWIGRLITASYRYYASAPKINLVVQSHKMLSHVKDRLVHADVCHKEFNKRWGQLPLAYRVLIPVLAPIFGLGMRVFGNRKLLARAARSSMRLSSYQTPDGQATNPLHEVLLHWRDRHLIRILERERKKPENQGAKIGIVYGASHMRAVISHLVKKCDYRLAGAEYVKVFDL